MTSRDETGASLNARQPREDAPNHDGTAFVRSQRANRGGLSAEVHSTNVTDRLTGPEQSGDESLAPAFFYLEAGFGL